MAGLSMLVPSAPTTDPWGWIVWGREVLHLELSTIVPGSPSWKPLPVLFTTPLALTGDAAPGLWVWLARAGGLAGLVLGFCLADQLAGKAAGLLAVGAIAAGPFWVHEMGHGFSEPLAIGLLFGAFLCEFSGRPREALLLGALVALVRPDAWSLVVLYGMVLIWRRQINPFALAAVVLVVPALWLVPDWLGSGDPFHGSKVAEAVLPSGASAAWDALRDATLLVPLALSATAVIGLVLAMRRGDHRYLKIAIVMAVWSALIIGLMFTAYPADERFFILPAALLAVLGSAGAETAVRALRPRWRLAAAGLVALGLLPHAANRTERSILEARAAVGRARLEADLSTTVRAAAGELRRCDRPILPAGLSWLKGQVAWLDDVPFENVGARSNTAVRFLRRLRREPALRLSRRDTEVVFMHKHGFVMFYPFSDAQVKIGYHPEIQLETVGAAGPWRAVVPRRRLPCPPP